MDTARTTLLQGLVAVTAVSGLGSLVLGIVVLRNDEPDETGVGLVVGQVATTLGLLVVALSVASIVLLSRGSTAGPVLAILATLAACPFASVQISWLTRGMLGPFDLILALGWLLAVVTIAVMVLGQLRERA